MASNSIKPHKYYQRVDFTEDEKVHIAKKSQDRCGHWGQLAHIGHAATLDHCKRNGRAAGRERG